jgi:hypothetical protein
MSFPYFVMKEAPVSGVKSMMNYETSLTGEVHDDRIDMWIRVVVPVTSLCPCSKKISDYGAHNQRSHITIAARVREHLWIEELIDIAESEASCELYGILKRPDEKFVTERAYDNPKFVEDIVRDVAVRLNTEARVRAYVVEAENFESIHNPLAYGSRHGPRDSSDDLASPSAIRCSSAVRYTGAGRREDMSPAEPQWRQQAQRNVHLNLNRRTSYWPDATADDRRAAGARSVP